MWVGIMELGLMNTRVRVLLPIPREQFVAALPGCWVQGEREAKEGQLGAWPRWLTGA